MNLLYSSLALIQLFTFSIFIADACYLHLPAGLCTVKTTKSRRLIPKGESQNIDVIKLQNL